MYQVNTAVQRASNVTLFKYLGQFRQKLMVNEICTVAPSTGASEKYEWLGEVPGMSEFLDERQIKALSKHDYTITNRKWEDTLGFDKSDLEDNRPIINTRIPMLAQAAASHPDVLAISTLVAGSSSLCFDGKAFFAADHPALYDGGDTYSNIVTGDDLTDGVTAANCKTNFNTAIARVLGWTKRSGDPLFHDIGTPLILHSPTLKSAMDEAFLQQYASGGENNIYYKVARPRVWGGLTGNKWYILFTNQAIKPLILQERQPITPAWDTTQEFQKGKLFYGVEARYNVGYAFPWLAVLINCT